MNESTGITTTEDNMAVVNAADVVVLAVKPHIVAPVTPTPACGRWV